MSVAIVGGGVTGLTTAILLLERGIPVTLYEASTVSGGLAGSWHKDGFAFDFGPHEFCTSNPALQTLLADVRGDDLLTIEKRSAQHFNKQFVRYPFEVADVLRNVDPLLCGKALLEVAGARIANLFRRPADASFEDWTRARYGKTLYDAYFGPYTEKVWGIPPSQLDPRTATQRITVDSLWDLLKRSVGYQFFGREDHTQAHNEYRRSFYYVRRGIGTLQEHLVRRLHELGGRIELGRRLVAVERGDQGAVTGLRFADGSRADDFDRVVSTIPLPALLGMTLGERGAELARTHALPFRGMVFLFLRIAKPQVMDYHWVYFPDLDIPFQRTTEFVHFGADMTPPGKTGMTLEIASTPGDAVWESSDQELTRRCLDSLESLGVLAPAEVLGVDVVRVANVYPVQVMDFLEKSEALIGALEEAPNLVTIGRQGLFRYCNMNECMEMAMDVVPRLVSGESSIRYRGDATWQGVAITDGRQATLAMPDG